MAVVKLIQECEKVRSLRPMTDRVLVDDFFIF